MVFCVLNHDYLFNVLYPKINTIKQKVFKWLQAYLA